MNSIARWFHNVVPLTRGPLLIQQVCTCIFRRPLQRAFTAAVALAFCTGAIQSIWFWDGDIKQAVGAEPKTAQTASADLMPQAQASADARIDAFRHATDPVARRQAFLQVQGDPIAVQRMNDPKLGNADLISNFNRESAGVRGPAKEQVIKEIAQRYKVDPSKVEFVEHGTTPENNPQKAGQDWDATIRIKGRGDVPTNVSEKIVQKAYLDSATMKGTPHEFTVQVRNADGTKRSITPNEFAHGQSLAVTDHQHSDAYGGGKTEGDLINRMAPDRNGVRQVDPGTRLRDPTQMSQAIEFKSNEARERAEKQAKKGQPVDAEGSKLEQVRQATKQYDKYVKAMTEAHGGKVPNQVQKGMDVLKEVSDGKITPAQANEKLKAMGESVDSIVKKSAGLVEAAHVLKAPGERAPAAGGDAFGQSVSDRLKNKGIDPDAPRSLNKGRREGSQAPPKAIGDWRQRMEQHQGRQPRKTPDQGKPTEPRATKTVVKPQPPKSTSEDPTGSHTTKGTENASKSPKNTSEDPKGGHTSEEKTGGHKSNGSENAPKPPKNTSEDPTGSRKTKGSENALKPPKNTSEDPKGSRKTKGTENAPKSPKNTSEDPTGNRKTKGTENAPKPPKNTSAEKTGGHKSKGTENTSKPPKNTSEDPTGGRKTKGTENAPKPPKSTTPETNSEPATPKAQTTEKPGGHGTKSRAAAAAGKVIGTAGKVLDFLGILGIAQEVADGDLKGATIDIAKHFLPRVVGKLAGAAAGEAVVPIMSTYGSAHEMSVKISDYNEATKMTEQAQSREYEAWALRMGSKFRRAGVSKEEVGKIMTAMRNGDKTPAQSKADQLRTDGVDITVPDPPAVEKVNQDDDLLGRWAQYGEGILDPARKLVNQVIEIFRPSRDHDTKHQPDPLINRLVQMGAKPEEAAAAIGAFQNGDRRPLDHLKSTLTQEPRSGGVKFIRSAKASRPETTHVLRERPTHEPELVTAIREPVLEATPQKVTPIPELATSIQELDPETTHVLRERPTHEPELVTVRQIVPPIPALPQKVTPIPELATSIQELDPETTHVLRERPTHEPELVTAPQIVIPIPELPQKVTPIPELATSIQELDPETTRVLRERPTHEPDPETIWPVAKNLQPEQVRLEPKNRDIAMHVLRETPTREPDPETKHDLRERPTHEPDPETIWPVAKNLQPEQVRLEPKNRDIAMHVLRETPTREPDPETIHVLRETPTRERDPEATQYRERPTHSPERTALINRDDFRPSYEKTIPQGRYNHDDGAVGVDSVGEGQVEGDGTVPPPQPMQPHEKFEDWYRDFHGWTNGVRIDEVGHGDGGQMDAGGYNESGQMDEDEDEDDDDDEVEDDEDEDEVQMHNGAYADEYDEGGQMDRVYGDSGYDDGGYDDGGYDE